MGLFNMLRKFYIFEPRTHAKPMIAALGYFNTKAFEQACRKKNIPCAVISEEAARIALERSEGVGVGVYTLEGSLNATEALKRQTAALNRRAVVDLTGVLVVEPPIRLEPIKQLLLA